MTINYIVYSNGNYINTCNTYSEACELRDRLERMWATARITIECVEYYD